MTEPVEPVHGCTINGQPAMPILISEYNALVARAAEAEQAEAELRRYTEAESADAAAGSYAGRAEAAEAERDELAQRLSEARSGEAILGQRVLHWVALTGSHQHWGQRRWNAWKNARCRARNWRVRAEQAEAALARVRALADRWTKAGPPPLGTPIARWVDRRLVELNTALAEPKDAP